MMAETTRYINETNYVGDQIIYGTEVEAIPEISDAIDRVNSIGHEWQGIEDRLGRILSRMFGPQPVAPDGPCQTHPVNSEGDIHALKDALRALNQRTLNVSGIVSRLERL